MTPAVFSHGSLRLYLLSLLSETSMHGYELMQALDERFGGTYKPSAGTIYPRLAKLEEEGLVTKQKEGRRAVYAITEAGRSELEARKGMFQQLEETITKANIAGPAKYLSHWPGNAGYGAGGANARPRSATIVITKNDGGLIGA